MVNETIGLYLVFHKLPSEEGKKTDKFLVSSKRNGRTLGLIKWFNRWRKYTFEPEPETVWDESCLNDIVIFISNLMKERKLTESSQQTKET